MSLGLDSSLFDSVLGTRLDWDAVAPLGLIRFGNLETVMITFGRTQYYRYYQHLNNSYLLVLTLKCGKKYQVQTED